MSHRYKINLGYGYITSQSYSYKTFLGRGYKTSLRYGYKTNLCYGYETKPIFNISTVSDLDMEEFLDNFSKTSDKVAVKIMLNLVVLILQNKFGILVCYSK